MIILRKKKKNEQRSFACISFEDYMVRVGAKLRVKVEVRINN